MKKHVCLLFLTVFLSTSIFANDLIQLKSDFRVLQGSWTPDKTQFLQTHPGEIIHDCISFQYFIPPVPVLQYLHEFDNDTNFAFLLGTELGYDIASAVPVLRASAGMSVDLKEFNNFKLQLISTTDAGPYITLGLPSSITGIDILQSAYITLSPKNDKGFFGGFGFTAGAHDISFHNSVLLWLYATLTAGWRF